MGKTLESREDGLKTVLHGKWENMFVDTQKITQSFLNSPLIETLTEEVDKVKKLGDSDIVEQLKKNYASIVSLDALQPTYSTHYPELDVSWHKEEVVPVPAPSLQPTSEKRARLASLGKQYQHAIEEYEKEMHEHALFDSRVPSTSIFNLVINENELATCFREIYSKFFGLEKKEILEGKVTPIDFAVYLFLVVVRAGLGKDDFALNSRKPFYNFIKNKVILDIGKTDRTFVNRLNEMGDLRDRVTNNPLVQKGSGRVKIDEIHYGNFLKVYKIFLRSNFYRNLKRLKLE